MAQKQKDAIPIAKNDISLNEDTCEDVRTHVRVHQEWDDCEAWTDQAEHMLEGNDVSNSRKKKGKGRLRAKGVRAKRKVKTKASARKKRIATAARLLQQSPTRKEHHSEPAVGDPTTATDTEQSTPPVGVPGPEENTRAAAPPVAPRLAVKTEDVPPSTDVIEPPKKRYRVFNPGAYAKFLRSLEPAKDRPARSDKCPDDLALRIKGEAATGAGTMTLAKWYKIRQESDNWGDVELRLEQVKRQTRGRGGTERWLMECQMMDIFKSQTVVDELKNEAMLKKSWNRPNPRAPNSTLCQQYLVVVDEGEDWRSEDKY